MKGYMLSIFVFFAVFATAYSIKCYVCVGTGDTCSKDNLEKDKDKYAQTCPANANQCIRAWGKKKDGTINIVNGCASDALCKKEKDACDNKSDEIDKCAVGCCSDDLCNAGSPVSFSVFLMTVCAALGLALLK